MRHLNILNKIVYNPISIKNNINTSSFLILKIFIQIDKNNHKPTEDEFLTNRAEHMKLILL